MENKIPVPQEQLTPELEKQNQNPYEQSKIVDVLLGSDVCRIAFVDIDSTFTGTIEDQTAARQALEQAGYQVVHVTSRTPEMTIGRAEVEISPEFKRPAPKLIKSDSQSDGTIDSNRDSGVQFTTAYPNEAPSFAGIYNPVATLASTGTEIWIQQQDESYRLDTDFEEKLGVDRATWRQETISKINQVNAAAGNPAKYAPLEDITNFNQGDMDVAPPDLRVQLNFGNLEEQLTYMEKMRAEHPEIRVIEDGNPDYGRFQVYLASAGAGKEQAVERFFQQTLYTMNQKLPAEQQVQPQDIETLFIGDSWPDVPMGLFGAKGSKATLLLVGGSRITPLVGDQRAEELKFGSENFTKINKKIIPQSKQGYYEYEDRTIVTGEAFPDTKAPQTIIAFLESQK